MQAVEIAQILKDRESGSLVLLERLIKALDQEVRRPDFSRESYHDLLTGIRKELRHFAAIENFLAPLIGLMGKKSATAEKAIGYMVDYRKYWADSAVKMADNFLLHCHPAGLSILTHSHSQTIISLLEQLQLRQIPFRVLQSLSHPGEEGRIAYERMRQMHMQAELIDDSLLLRALERADLVIMGCDTLLATDFLNKSGTRAILEMAGELEIPSYLISESRKVISAPDWKEHLPEKSLFEWVDLDLVDRIITEQAE